MTDEFQIAKLHLKAGDTLVIKVAGRLSDERLQRVRAMAAKALPDGVKLMAIDDSVELSAVRAA